MNKRVFIVHGWGGYPEKGWYSWMRKELEARGFEVFAPRFPETNNPRIQSWISTLARIVGITDENTYFVGHSLGCLTIARYLETLPENVKVGGVVFVAGFFKRLTGFDDDSSTQETIRHWLDTPIDLKQVKAHLPKSIAIFSDDDYYVPLDNQDNFRDKLGSEIIIKHQAGHFSGDDGIIELPIALEALLKIAQ